MEEGEFAPLVSLLNSPSKQFVDQVFVRAFQLRNEKETEVVIEALMDGLGLNQEESKSLVDSVMILIRMCLRQNRSSAEEIAEIFPESFHSGLKTALSSVILKHFNEWKRAEVDTSVSLPRLLEFDWKVHTRKATDRVDKMSAPTVIVQMKLQENQTEEDHVADVRNIQFELPKESLDAILSGLGRIRGQLSSIK